MRITPKTIATGFAFPECPRWRDGELWFSDMHLGKVFRMSAAGSIVESFDVPGRPSGLGWLPGGDLLIVSMQECRLYRRNGGALIVYAELKTHHRVNSNDMVIDKQGRAYIGALGFDYEIGEEQRSAPIAFIGAGAEVSLATGEMRAANGMVITPDGRTLIVAESFANCLTAFDIDEHGGLSNQRIFADLGEHAPDGICLDADGAVWVASIYSGSVLRVSEGGKVSERVVLESGNAYACMLGGADGKDLYICCANDYDPQTARTTRQGRIDVARAPVPHAGLP